MVITDPWGACGGHTRNTTRVSRVQVPRGSVITDESSKLSARHTVITSVCRKAGRKVSIMAIAVRENPVVMTAGEAVNLVRKHREDFPHNTKPGTNDQNKMTVQYHFSNPDVHPYDEVNWVRRNIDQMHFATGATVFEQHGVEFPDTWSVNASTIVTTKYFRGAMNTEDREWSLKQVIDRVVKTYRLAGTENGYFASESDARAFEWELTWLLLNQFFAFNSPVWFNVGTKEPQQVSACFILAVDDSMESILNWYREEGMVFKGGSGAGVSLSNIRSSKELLSSGGTASGPVSFMRGADASAGTIKSGGATRRAAKMVVLDVDHPDIVEFAEAKMLEEGKIRALQAAGYDMGVNGADIISVQYQNANNSVRVTDQFMAAVESGGTFDLTARKDGRVIETVNARELFDTIVHAAWDCAEPGIQFDTTINDWHTSPETGRITASNPCSEYMSLDNSSCNLASLRLTKYVRQDGSFDVESFTAAVEIVILAMEISITFADFPTQLITDTTHRYRQLGIGYADLGALLMQSGLPYDSDAGRAYAASITSLMQAVAYRRSAELAGVVGVYEGYPRNAAPHQRVILKHIAANDALKSSSPLDEAVLLASTEAWALCQRLGKVNGYRNAQVSVLAPTGTIGFMMDCDTTGVEPDMALIKNKKMVGGGSMKIINLGVPAALGKLGYTDETIKAIVAHVSVNGNVVNAPGMKPEHYAVFDCALGDLRAISPMGHVRMMGAVQPFLSGAISKTVNMPEIATEKEVAEIYYESWRLGIKALAIYRDNCKVGQPLSAGTANAVVVNHQPVRRRLPGQRRSLTTSFAVGGAEGYMTAGLFPDDNLGEVFLKLGKQGSTLAGVMDAFSIAISIALQYGVPLEALVSKFVNMSFEPAGLTGNDTDIRMASSIMDYVFRRLALDHLPLDTRTELGIYTANERTARVERTYGNAGSGPTDRTKDNLMALAQSVGIEPTKFGQLSDAPLCRICGTRMQAAGSCYVCDGCGDTSGCS